MWVLFVARLDRLAGKITNGYTVPDEDIPDMLTEAWEQRAEAIAKCDMHWYETWSHAFDRLFDCWLIQRPELRCDALS